MSQNVLVIGAGPAGLAAAVAARAAGARVTMLDSSDYLGGQYWRHLPAERPSQDEERLHHGWGKFTKLRSALEADAGCEIVTSAQVWSIENYGGGAFGDDSAARHEVHVLVGPPDGINRENRSYTPDSIVMATGAHDRTLPFPGWDLPGVFSAGAAQAMAKGERVAVGQRVVVAGAGPFLLPVATSLSQVGATVLGVYEASRLGSLITGWLPQPWQLIGASGKATELIEYVGNHLRHRIPYRIGHAVIAANGTDRVESVTIAAVDAKWSPIPGTEKTIAADAVCVSHGFTPRLELPIAVGCDLSAERFVLIDDAQQTSVASVYAAGEITGIGGVDAALAEGTIAGHCAAGGSSRDETIAGAVKRRVTFTGFASRIEAAHGIRSDWVNWLKEDTLVCRCEEVTYGKLRATGKRTEAQGLRSQKLSSRAALGICQGRICGRSVEDIMCRETPGGLIDGASIDRRPIVTPIRLGELAGEATK
ncbi:FAD-dependent oxidoreductase [Lysinibacter cavernae]|uniref:NADPH-dependent 2,4-dienoyl-CoA reductase/sulfur reductase-like enzyme n=1 Tax=Lysinibacter cavernae TaxID=1640652 RepID=A0A7X5R3B6_9MICO|nr:FAD-dependent oxidoreductase [Lysinibacter cavernae]NIH54900.1 NADPH-dependent 2,4-dienoyl-CoA reductase/sulfur reductase-like enzyme [Lysinibacter cavernae]